MFDKHQHSKESKEFKSLSKLYINKDYVFLISNGKNLFDEKLMEFLQIDHEHFPCVRYVFYDENKLILRKYKTKINEVLNFITINKFIEAVSSGNYFEYFNNH